MLRNIKAIAVAGLVVSLMTSAAIPDTVMRGGPVKPIPNPRFVVQLTCSVAASANGPEVFVVNSLSSPLPSGRKVYWSYHQLGGLRGAHTWAGTDVSGSLTLTQALGAGQPIKVAQTTLGAQISNCKASTMVGG